MSELFLVRHGQASFGEDDYDRLSDRGHQQARWLGEYFQHRRLEFDQVIRGEMLRHRQTTEGIAEGLGASVPEPEVDAGWNEFDFETLIRIYLKQFPEEEPAQFGPAEFTRLLRRALLTWAAGELEAGMPESWADFETRVRRALERITAQEAKGKKVLLISSGGAICMALRQVLKTSPSIMVDMNLQVRNTSFSHLYFNRQKVLLSAFNNAPHLDHPERNQSLSYF